MLMLCVLFLSLSREKNPARDNDNFSRKGKRDMFAESDLVSREWVGDDLVARGTG